jgi:hypothetical protein
MDADEEMLQYLLSIGAIDNPDPIFLDEITSYLTLEPEEQTFAPKYNVDLDQGLDQEIVYTTIPNEPIEESDDAVETIKKLIRENEKLKLIINLKPFEKEELKSKILLHLPNVDDLNRFDVLELKFLVFLFGYSKYGGERNKALYLKYLINLLNSSNQPISYSSPEQTKEEEEINSSIPEIFTTLIGEPLMEEEIEIDYDHPLETIKNLIYEKGKVKLKLIRNLKPHQKEKLKSQILLLLPYITTTLKKFYNHELKFLANLFGYKEVHRDKDSYVQFLRNLPRSTQMSTTVSTLGKRSFESRKAPMDSEKLNRLIQIQNDYHGKSLIQQEINSPKNKLSIRGLNFKKEITSELNDLSREQLINILNNITDTMLLKIVKVLVADNYDLPFSKNIPPENKDYYIQKVVDYFSKK